LQPRAAKPPPEAFAHGAAGDAARAEFGRAYTEMMKREWFSIGIHLGYRYEGSPLIIPDGTPEPPDEVMDYTPTARPGHRAPHAWLQDRRSTLDLFGRGFVLLRLGADPPNADNLMAAAQNAQLPLEIIAIADPAIAALYGKGLVLVRPDGHVCWRSDALPPDPTRLLATITGAAS
jgi:hypothetical protein